MLGSQNIYDDPEFFAGYKKLRDEGSAQNDILEQPALWSLLGDSLNGLTVLDLGCGFGGFARKARALGASSVLAIDLSENMLTEARRRTSDDRIEFRRSSMEDLELPPQSFDLAVSSLMLHYVEAYEPAVRNIAACLKPGGRFVFSVEHPMLTALPGQDWVRASDGTPLHWPVDHYRDEGERRIHWFVEGVVKYHRTMETWVNTLLAAGFTLERLLEPEPLAGAPCAQALLERRRPPFLLLAARR